MKRVLAIIITLVLALSFVSCGNKENKDNNDKNNVENPGVIPGVGPGGVDTPIIDIT